MSRKTLTALMKKKHEIGVFRRFAKVSGLPIIPESIEQPPEPEPDILCEIIGEGRVAFELTRIDDEAFRRMWVQMQEREAIQSGDGKGP